MIKTTKFQQEWLFSLETSTTGEIYLQCLKRGDAVVRSGILRQALATRVRECLGDAQGTSREQPCSSGSPTYPGVLF
ncbi:hypothetical protein [Nostoc sp. JL33]|uniref:hypothetical protein n=1 Tax=Nostoc sp. JL33 TaxID=2815396 RepID=UPI0025D1666A|nr:hypothetical protein [Nostoc sp. JL33]